MYRQDTSDDLRELLQSTSPAWETVDVPTAVQRETLMPGVEVLRTPLYTFVYIERKTDLDWQAEPLKSLVAEPGYRFFFMDGGRREDQDYFLDMYPNYSEAADGYAVGDSRTSRDGLRKIRDHHGKSRLSAESTCLQDFLESRCDVVFRNEEGKEILNFFAGHGDMDSYLAFMARLFAHKISKGEGGPELRKLYMHANIIDKYAAATLEVTEEELQNLNYLIDFQTDIQPEDASAARAEKLFEALQVFLQRAQAFIQGKGSKAELESRMKYEVLKSHPEWSTVWEADPVARRRMLEDGLPAALILKGPATEKFRDSTENAQAFSYTLQKIDHHSSFPLRDVLGFLNYIDTLSEEETENDDALLEHLSTLPPDFPFHIYKGTFGGSDTVGGGVTRHPWQLLDTGMSWYLSRGGNRGKANPRMRTALTQANLRNLLSLRRAS